MTAFQPDAATAATAPVRTHRLIPSRFPPVQTFDMADTAEDLAAVMELEGWTNDRLSETRLRRLPEEEWVFGRPNASIVMASFLHGSPNGLRFTSPDLGAWYASSKLETAMVEVLNGLRREIGLSALDEKVEEYRAYTARLDGSFVDIRGTRPDLHDPDIASYPQCQRFGEEVRASAWTGIAYDSVRHPGGENWVSYRPTAVTRVTQAQHYRATLRATGKVIVEQIAAP
ncbi:MAG: RES family NAD+ phosphorylase [Rhodobacteraceae bacterium]|nr:RES family NAD+ phosphorylase [Paracoccaceae bacterium]